MIKRRLCILLAFSLLLTGCSSVSMTKTESGQVAEYIAYSLLKYHESPEVFVTNTKTPSEEPEASNEPVSTTEPPQQNNATAKPDASQTPGAGTQEPAANAGALFGSKNFAISVKSKGEYESYPKNSSSTYFSLSANEGKKLLVLELTAKNTGESKEVFKTSGSALGYLLNGSSNDKALVTILEHDIHFVKSAIKPGKSLKTLIFFEVDNNFNSENLSLTLQKSSQSVKLSVK